jgi:hypothetical protein
MSMRCAIYSSMAILGGEMCGRSRQTDYRSHSLVEIYFKEWVGMKDSGIHLAMVFSGNG